MTGTESVCIKLCGIEEMNPSLVNAILDSAGRYREETGNTVFPRYFNEATSRNDFVEMIEKQFRLQLTFDSFWFPTNGEGLAILPDSGWKRLAATGFSWLRLAFHGIREEHDAFLDRPGAWDILAGTAAKAEEHGIHWYPVIFLNRHNAHRYEEIRSAVENIGSPSLPAGWMIPNWQNRPEFDINRVSYRQISHLVGENTIWQSETGILKMIASDPVLADSRAFNPDSGIFYMGVSADGGVFYAGGCHGEPFRDHRRKMMLGSFHENQDIGFYLRAAADRLPEQAKVLSEASFGELADRFGDPDSDLVYRIQDLAVNKWGAMLLDQTDFTGS